MISSLCLSMIFSENRFPLFRIMLYGLLHFARNDDVDTTGPTNQACFVQTEPLDHLILFGD